MIQEGVVLLGVKHFQEGASRVAVYPLTDLVDFVDEDQWVLDTDTLECLDDLARQGSVVKRTLAQPVHVTVLQHTQRKSFDDP